MRVLMLNPPFIGKFSRSSRSPAVPKGGTLYYPLWLSYATGVLENEGYEVKLIDAPASGFGVKKVINIVKKCKPELVVLDTSTPSIYNDVSVLEKIKAANKCFAVLVGPQVSALPEETLKISKDIDAIARHEYDYILRDLAAELGKKNPNLKKVRGLSFRKGEKIIHNPNMPLIQNLDEIPFVSAIYKKHLNAKNYFYSANLYPEITIVTGRGCPYRCTFCVMPQTMMGRGYRMRGTENVLAELEYIKKQFPYVKEIFIEDDTFTANKQRVKELCRKIIERKLNITWSANARADVDFETLKIMKKAGCRLLCVGFESAVQEILNNVRKGTRVETIRQFMKDSKKAGILVHGCFMLGNDGETKETINKTIAFAKELEPDTAQFFPIMVYPGTYAFELFKKQGFIKSTNWRDWLDEEGNHNCMVSRPGLTSEELVNACNNARRQFYLRPKYMSGKLLQAISSPSEAGRIFKSAGRFYKFLLSG